MMNTFTLAGMVTAASAIKIIHSPVNLFSSSGMDSVFKFGARLLESSDTPEVPYSKFVADFNASLSAQDPSAWPRPAPGDKHPTLKDYASFYHTSDEIRAELETLSKTCPAAANFRIESKKAQTEDGKRAVDIQFVTLGNQDAEHRVFMLAGEHAREFIAAESALHFLQSLCGKTDIHMNNLLDTTLFQVVVNANEASRRKAEDGHFCLRVNPAGVDLNRNWDTHWRKSMSTGSETYGGPAAFSEPETVIFRDLVNDFKPTAFLSIHSGTKAMFTPYAYAPKLPDFNARNMSHLLRDLDTKYCQCPFGPAGSELPYLSRGTCMDYVYENLELPYAFVFELWGPPEDDQRMKDRFKEDLEIHKDNFMFHHARENELGSDFHERDTDKTPVVEMEEKFGHSECFHIFNPEHEDDFVQLRKDWTSLYRDLSERLVDAPAVSQLNQHGPRSGAFADA